MILGTFPRRHQARKILLYTVLPVVVYLQVRGMIIEMADGNTHFVYYLFCIRMPNPYPACSIFTNTQNELSQYEGFECFRHCFILSHGVSFCLAVVINKFVESLSFALFPAARQGIAVSVDRPILQGYTGPLIRAAAKVGG